MSEDKIIYTNSNMNKSELKKLSKSQLIRLLLKHDDLLTKLTSKPKPIAKPRSITKPKPEPRKSVKEMVREYEDNIILPPPEFRDDYKPVPLPRTQKPIPMPRTQKPVPMLRTKIEPTDKALKGYTTSYKIGIKDMKNPLVQLQNTRTAIRLLLIKELASKKGIQIC